MAARWLSLAGAIWLQTVNGPNADFPVYSSHLKEIKHLSQVQLNFLAFASDAGKLLGFVSGVAELYLPLWIVALVGALFGLIGYGVQFLYLDSARLSFWPLFLLTALAGNGICWINTVCYLLCIRNFGFHSRVAVGVSTSYVGLSAKVYTAIAGLFLRWKFLSGAKLYLLLNAVVPVIVTVASAPAIRVLDAGAKTQSSSSTGATFLAMFAITLVTGVCAVLGSIGSTGLSLRDRAISLGVMLACPLLVPAALRARDSISKMRDAKRDKTRIKALDVEAPTAASETPEGKVQEDDGEAVSAAAAVQGEEVGGLAMVGRLDFWLYYLSYMLSATVGLVFLNNLGQIAESRGLGSSSSTLVSLASSFGFFGRLIPALLDYLSIRSGCNISRTAFMAVLMGPMAGAFLLLLQPRALFLYMATTVIGACTGAITSTAVSTTTELFGTKHFGVNHNIVVTNIPVGSLGFGYLAAFLYQRGGGGGGRSKCFGPGCYRATFLIWGFTCALATCLCSILYARLRRTSSRITAGD